MIRRELDDARCRALERRRAKRAAEVEREFARRRDASRTGDDDPALIVERRETSERICDALMRLPADERAAVILRDIEGRSTRSATEALFGAGDDRSCNAFSHHLSKARSGLWALLVDEFELESGSRPPRWDAAALLEFCFLRAGSRGAAARLDPATKGLAKPQGS